MIARYRRAARACAMSAVLLVSAAGLLAIVPAGPVGGGSTPPIAIGPAPAPVVPCPTVGLVSYAHETVSGPRADVPCPAAPLDPGTPTPAPVGAAPGVGTFEPPRTVRESPVVLTPGGVTVPTSRPLNPQRSVAPASTGQQTTSPTPGGGAVSGETSTGSSLVAPLLSQVPIPLHVNGAVTAGGVPVITLATGAG